MKKTVTAFLTFLFIVNYSCKEKIDYEKEKKAIITVVEEETAAYYASDFDHWSAVYVQDSTNTAQFATRNYFNYYLGWDEVSANAKSYIVSKKEFQKEVKTPVRIKVYGESAWIVFYNENESGVKDLETCFLEKHNGRWKIILRNVTGASSYTDADMFLINSINYAKSLGKKVEDIASFAGDQFKVSWNKANGYNGFVNGTLYNWRNMVLKEEFKILEQDSNHVVFIANKMLPGLKNGPMYNVTYDEYLTFPKIVFEKIAEYMGAIYKQEATPDGVRVTISKK